MSSSVIEKLRNDSDYYGEYGSKYLSNSDIYSLLKKPREFRKSEPTAEMLLGRYFHTLLLEPEKIENFPIAKASTRSTNVFKNMIEETNLGKYDVILQKEADLVLNWAEAVKENFVMNTDIYAKGNEFEVPAVGTIFGTQWKGKADIVTSENVIDLKTTSNIDRWKWSSHEYNYDSQAYIYQQLFGKPVLFYIIDKNSLRLKIAHASEDTLLDGRDKVMKAIEVYNRFFGPEASEQITQFIEYEEF